MRRPDERHGEVRMSKWGGDRELPPGPASHIGFNGISGMPRPNLRRSVTDLTDSSDPGPIEFARHIVDPLTDTEPDCYQTRSHRRDAGAEPLRLCVRLCRLLQ